MPIEKNMTLLTPAVLHCSALEYLTEQSSDFHRKYIIRFSIMQGIWVAILFITVIAGVVMPRVSYIRETGITAFTNANFTHCQMSNGALIADFKPAIWSYTVSDSATQRDEIIVDTTGTFNRFYWDDRVERGVVKKVNGVGFMKEYLFVKKGTQINRIPYRLLGVANSEKLTKGALYERFLKITNKETIVLWSFLLLPVALLFGGILGSLFHGFYVLIFGTLLRVMAGKFVVNSAIPYKIASGLYVGWAYVVALAMVAQQILEQTFVSIPGLFWVVKIVGLIATLLIGYLCLRVRQLRPMAASITKVTRRAK